MAEAHVDASVSTAPAESKNPLARFLSFLASHPPGFWFIFWGEFAERCSYYGMRAILAVYMADRLELGKANGGMYFAFFTAACYLLPLIGGYVADNYFGKYRTIVAFSLPYILGHVVLGMENTLALFIALCLLAMGAGVIKPNISTLMGLTYDQYRPGNELLRTQAFSMFYMSINIGAAISQFVIPVIKDHYDYQLAFLFPAILMAVSFVFFAAGKPFYATEIIARHKKTPEEYREMFRVVRKISGVFTMVVFFWAIFDQSASTWIYFGTVYQYYFTIPLLGRMTPERIQFFNPVLIVIFLPFVTWLWTALDHKGIKVKATTKMLCGFVLTGLCMFIMAVAALRAGSLQCLYVPLEGINAEDLAREKIEKTLPPAFDAATMVAGLAGPHLSPAAAATTTLAPLGKTLYVPPESKVTLWWQGLAYLMLTIAEILISVTGLEMAFVVAPKTMKGFITSLWLLTVFLANFALNAPLSRLYPRMNPAMYFLMLTGMLVAVVLIFLVVAARFNRLVAAEAATQTASDAGHG